MSEIAFLLRRGADCLRGAGIEGAFGEARLLLEAAAGITRARQIAHPEDRVPADLEMHYDGLVQRRARREPISRILGRREFWSLSFTVTARTLDPRPDSETLVRMVLEAISVDPVPRRILDLGTGTGCLLLALLSELLWASGLGIDCSEGAVEVARVNAQALGLSERAQFQIGDWDLGLLPSWDVIVSNPPYIPSDLIDGLESEVSRYEPRLALDGGPDGLDCHRRLLPAAGRLLRPGGIAVFEFGQGQETPIIDLGEAVGLALVTIQADLSGTPRCAMFRRI